MKETISGIIIKKKIGGTSKSAHTAFVLKTASEELKLRRVGGNPFYDKYFEDYENKSVQVTGTKSDNLFYITKIQSL
jgi:hypothetical protein